MDHETVVAYLDRVGVATPAAGDAAGLRTLHRAHQLTVPFENLSIHLAEPISLDEPDLIDKIVRRRRGGFCYELNGAFALLLEALGAQVSRVGARVHGEAGLSPPLDHLALIVRPGSPTWASAATAITRCCWRHGMTRTIRPAGSGSPTPAMQTSTS
jgi:N-hydroxyarylamine O-acetyltransferase